MRFRVGLEGKERFRWRTGDKPGLYGLQYLEGFRDLGFMTYIVHSLLSKGRILYETVVKENGKLQAQLIEREGPTGLLVTAAAVLLHPENETRMLSILVNDTPEQTQNMLLALARKTGGAVDPTPWQALQTWLELAEHRVIIPYAETLANKLPPVAVRLRRDFGAVLNLIEAHAILHQASRERDAQGCIVATLEDYIVVRELVGNLVSEGVRAAVPPTTRETVEAVQAVGEEGAAEVTVSQVARLLGLDKSTALRRVNTAIKRGYLENMETHRGRPYRLVIGEPLPDNLEVLPPAEALAGCTGASGCNGA